MISFIGGQRQAIAYLVGKAQLLCGTDAGGRERRRDRGSCQGALHCGLYTKGKKNVYGTTGVSACSAGCHGRLRRRRRSCRGKKREEEVGCRSWRSSRKKKNSEVHQCVGPSSYGAKPNLCKWMARSCFWNHRHSTSAIRRNQEANMSAYVISACRCWGNRLQTSTTTAAR